MLGMGATLSIKEFVAVVLHPTGVGIGVGLQWVVVPLLALLAGQALGLSPGWAVGLILVSVTPGGAFSNLLTYLGRGHLALSISVTLVATLASIVSAPLLLGLLASAHLPERFAFPTGRILLEVGAYLLLPLAVGMLVHHSLPRHAAAISKAAIWTSLALVLVIAGIALTGGRLQVGTYGWRPPLWILLFALAIHLGAAELSRLLRRFDDETLALSIEVSVRNGGVGLLLLRFFFQGQEEQMHALYTILFYTGLQVWVPVPAMLRPRAGRSPLWLRAPRRRPDPTPGS
jgi:BASS family bile acid:Na+ symporter